MSKAKSQKPSILEIIKNLLKLSPEDTQSIGKSHRLKAKKMLEKPAKHYIAQKRINDTKSVTQRYNPDSNNQFATDN